jgi:uncharacterized membrane protein
MRIRLSQILDNLRTGFWFVPSMMLLMAGLLALALLHLDRKFDPGMKSSIAWAYSGGPEGARSLLSTIAGSMMTAASVTFSLASVALSIASQQYGSRVLRNFMRDRVTQVLLGTFVSTFLYSVLVVRDIRGSDFSGGFVPAIAISVAIVLSLLSLLMLVYFVHHVSSSIQASHIVSTISKDMRKAIPKLFPSRVANPVSETEALPFREEPAVSVAIDQSGYLQSIDTGDLLALARQRNVFIEITLKPGDHVVEGVTVARVRPPTLNEEGRSRLLKAFLIGSARTPTQDIRYQFQQLTDVVVRALSPGINDPFTAVNGIDELTTGIALLARRPRTTELRQDADGIPRLFVPRPEVSDILRSTVSHIAIYASGDSFVMDRLHRVLKTVEPDLKGASELGTLASLRRELQWRERATQKPE